MNQGKFEHIRLKFFPTVNSSKRETLKISLRQQGPGWPIFGHVDDKKLAHQDTAYLGDPPCT